jgi:hypothetical protein
MNVDSLVRAAAPPTADLDDPAVLRALDQLPARLRDTSVTPDLARRRPVLVGQRRTRRLAIGLALVTSLAVAAPVAAATIVAAHTGLFGNPHHEEGSGELIRLDSPHFPQVLDQIRKREDLPLPPDSTWDRLPATFRVDGPSLETTSGIATNVELYARCAWLNAYITAADERRPELQQRAAQVIEQIPQWPQLSKATDPGFRSQLSGEASAAAAGHVGDPNATDFDAGNIARDYQVNCTSMAVGK